jgi:hypothetical protein
MIKHLIEILPEPRRPPLHEQLRLLDQAIDRNFSEPEDRQHIRTGDAHGGDAEGNRGDENVGISHNSHGFPQATKRVTT